jgi:hypothetical protein
MSLASLRSLRRVEKGIHTGLFVAREHFVMPHVGSPLGKSPRAAGERAQRCGRG